APHAAPPRGATSAVMGGKIKAVIALVAGDGLATDRQAQRVEGREHELELAQVGAMLFSVAILEQAVLLDIVVVNAEAGAVEAYGLGGQAVDAQPAPDQGGIER